MTCIDAHNVRDFGAIGDGNCDDGPAIQRALDSGQSLTVVPAGVYRIGRTLRVGSHHRLLAHRFARFVMADGAGADRHCHLIANADPRGGNADIHIEGGIWDGNNIQNPRGPDAPHSYTGVMMCFTRVENFALRDVTLINPESYYCRIDQVRRFWIEDVRLRATVIRPNQDGIHIGGGCEFGMVRRINGSGECVPNDDLVAVNPNDANHRAQNLGKTWAPVRHLQIDQLSAEDCHSFVRLLSVDDAIEDVTVSNLTGGCRICALNLDAGRQCVIPVFDADDPKYRRGAGLLRDIRVWNAQVHKSQGSAAKPLIHLMTNVENLCIEKCERDTDVDANPAAPTLGISHMDATHIQMGGVERAANGSDSDRPRDSSAGSPADAVAVRARCASPELRHRGGRLLCSEPRRLRPAADVAPSPGRPRRRGQAATSSNTRMTQAGWRVSTSGGWG